MLILSRLLKQIVGNGVLNIVDHTGKTHTISNGTRSIVTIKLHNKKIAWQLIINPELGLGEGYMDKSITLEHGNLYDLLDLCTHNFHKAPPSISSFFNIFLKCLRRFHQYNPVKRAQRNVHHHYNLKKELYDLFLDKDRQYSCAYFTSREDDLDLAQLNKKKHIASKLHLNPGQKILDIGCGWGGLSLYLAKLMNVEVTGLTLSEEQHKIATKRAEESGLSHRVKFLLQDYRQEMNHGTYDRIVSVGMFEHVGINHYQEFFTKVHHLLKSDGVALLHAIGRSFGPGATNAWIRKYIFPGGYCPALSEVLPELEKSKFYVGDVEILHHHYAETLKLWRTRFKDKWEHAQKIYDERFCRMWEYYLTTSEIAFRNLGFMVFQIQFSKFHDVIPLTRNYIGEREHEFLGLKS